MKPAGSSDWAKARNSNVIEDLGRVSYVFSDKTGTLTSNEMRLRAIAIKGTPYGSSDFRWSLPKLYTLPKPSALLILDTRCGYERLRSRGPPYARPSSGGCCLGWVSSRVGIVWGGYRLGWVSSRVRRYCLEWVSSRVGIV